MRVALVVLLLACASACRTGPLGSAPAPSQSVDGAVDLAPSSPTVDLARGMSVDMSMRPRPCGTDACQPGDLCQSAEGCCSCGVFGGACFPAIWTCGRPAENDPRCPANEPVSGDACALPDTVICWYCGVHGPRSAGCGWCAGGTKAACWGVAGAGGHCD